MKNSQMRRMHCRKLHFVVGRRPNARVTWLQPFQSNERQPAVRLLQSGRTLFAELGNFFLPARILRVHFGRAGKSHAKKSQKQSKKGSSLHRKSIARAANCAKSRRTVGAGALC